MITESVSATASVVAPDTLVALYPYDLETRRRTGAHPGKTYSASGKTAYTQGMFFQAEDVSFSTIEELHEALGALSLAGQSFIVRGQRAHSGEFLRRTPYRHGNSPPGLKGASLHVLPLDMDDVPNILRFAPRTHPEAAWRWLLSLLGPEFEGVRVSAHWSSSCCVGVPVGQAPECLDARLWLMMNKPLGSQSVRSLMKTLSARVTSYFLERGVVLERRAKPTSQLRPYHSVDPKIADVQQPIYIAAPRFRDGLVDPLPLRSALLDGIHGQVDISTIWMDEVEAPTAQPAAGKPVKEKAAKPARASKGKLHVPGVVLPLAASGRLIAAMRNMLAAALAGTGTEEYRAACTNMYHRRMALELVALCGHRGGAPEGERDEAATRIAAALVASLPLGWDRERVRGEIRQLLVPVCGSEWVDLEWEKGGGDTSVVNRYLAASRGKKTPSGRDPRYTYGKDRLVKEFSPTYDEVLELGLRSLCTDADRAAADREEDRVGAGSKARGEWLAEARKHAPEVHRLRAAGVSARKTAAQLGLPIAKVLRLLKLDASVVAGLAIDPVQEQVVQKPEVVMAALDQVAAIMGSISYLRASQGLETAAELAAALGEPVEWIHDLLDGGNLLERLRLAA